MNTTAHMQKLTKNRDSTGYSTAARGYIRGLVANGCDVATRHVHLSGSEIYEKFEQDYSDLKNVDVCIQHTLPSMFRKTKAKLDIGIFTWETTELPEEWVKSINKNVDAVFVPSVLDKCACSKLNKPVYVVGYPATIDKARINKNARLNDPIVNEDTHIFYSITSESPRKNLTALIMCFLCAFREDDNCLLLLHIASKDKDSARKELVDNINGIKDGLGLDSYPKIALSLNQLTDETINGIHLISDTYVSASHGESWNYPLFDAACLNNNVITTKCGGPIEYLDRDFDFVNGIYSPVYGMAKSSGGLYNAKSQWINFIANDLIDKMRNAYSGGKKKSSINNKLFSEYSEKNIGKTLLKNIKKILREKQ